MAESPAWASMRVCFSLILLIPSLSTVEAQCLGSMQLAAGKEPADLNEGFPALINSLQEAGWTPDLAETQGLCVRGSDGALVGLLQIGRHYIDGEDLGQVGHFLPVGSFVPKDERQASYLFIPNGRELLHDDALRNDATQALRANGDLANGTEITGANARLTTQGALIRYRLSDRLTVEFEVSSLLQRRSGANYRLYDAKGDFSKLVYNGQAYTAADLLRLLQVAGSTSPNVQDGFDVSRAKIVGVNVSDGSVTFERGNRTMSCQTVRGRVELGDCKVLEKRGKLISARFGYRNGERAYKTAQQLRDDVVRAIGPGEFHGVEVASLEAVDIDLLAGEVTFRDKHGMQLVASTAAGMTFDFLNDDSQTGVRILEPRGAGVRDQVIWARANGLDLPMSDRHGNRVAAVTLPNPNTRSARLVLETDGGISVLYEVTRGRAIADHCTYLRLPWGNASVTVQDHVSQKDALDWLTRAAAAELKDQKALLAQAATNGLVSIGSAVGWSWSTLADEGANRFSIHRDVLFHGEDFLRMLSEPGILTTEENRRIGEGARSHESVSLTRMTIRFGGGGRAALDFNGTDSAGHDIYGSLTWHEAASGGSYGWHQVVIGLDDAGNLRALNGSDRDFVDRLNQGLSAAELEKGSEIREVRWISFRLDEQGNIMAYVTATSGSGENVSFSVSGLVK